MLKVVSTILLLCSVAKSAELAGFASGREFAATPLEGTVVMTCEGFNGTGQAVYTCRDVVLDPQSYDTFIGPVDARASQVELRAEHEDGSTRVKMAGYNGKVGKSVSTFNLWVSTLFQKPLLMAGTNKLSYTIYNGSGESYQEYARGNFIVTVKRNSLRRCPTTQYNSTDVTDCNSQYSICQRYFEQYNNCQ
ncbi:hypothetical protein [Bdellovibrio svalbardensis]|uniref:Secreted protein n=1 Tax=Bdellovibrio svalbardensis TaxID=2972972 RepID=A0ABT6DE15_9BACT|nr:hypothetical protein [Bdellovibrio svalbardensis]MDG0815080.1 hypothetical protein [Bdellovibrio svalbardensis]